MTSRSFWRKSNELCAGIMAVGLCLSKAAYAQIAPEPPLTMEACVARALAHSPLARAAGFARDSALLDAERDRPVARPHLTAAASGSLQGPRVTFPLPDNSLATVLPEAVTRLDLVFEQEIYRPGLAAARRRYAAMTGAALADFAKSRADVALAVENAYLDVMRAESGLRLAQDGLTMAQRYEDSVKQRIGAGLSKPVDAQTAAAQTAEAQDARLRAAGGVALARAALNRALGRPLDTPLRIADLPPLPNTPLDADETVAAALRDRPEIQMLEQNVAAARAGVSLAASQNKPVLSARGQISEQTPSAFLHEHYIAATLEVKWPILDGDKTRLDTAQARAQEQRLEALLEDARQGIALDVTRALQQMDEARERMKPNQASVDAALAGETVAEKAYDLGRSTAIEVAAAQREVRAARERLLLAEYDLRGAAVALNYARGAAAGSRP